MYNFAVFVMILGVMKLVINMHEQKKKKENTIVEPTAIKPLHVSGNKTEKSYGNIKSHFCYLSAYHCEQARERIVVFIKQM